MGNAAGANLNREWGCTGEYEAPTLKRSPEVYHLLREMGNTGVDFLLDVHGDEELPHCFFCWNAWREVLGRPPGLAAPELGRGLSGREPRLWKPELQLWQRQCR